MLELRPMKEDDLDAVCEIEIACFSQPWSRDSLRYAIEAPQTDCIVLIAGGRLMGYGIFSCLYEDCEIMNLAVEAGARRKGYGRALLTAMLQHARALGCERAFLEVREGNLPASALYTQMGFRPYGRRKQYYRYPTEDAILMAAPLVPALEDLNIRQ